MGDAMLVMLSEDGGAVITAIGLLVPVVEVISELVIIEVHGTGTSVL